MTALAVIALALTGYAWFALRHRPPADTDIARFLVSIPPDQWKADTDA